MLNKVILIGHVGADPEIRSMNNGKEMASFNLATTKRWKDKETGDRKDKTEWHRVVVFSEPLVKVCRDYVQKGSKLYIEGELTTRKWNKDGVDHYRTEINLNAFSATLIMLDRADGSGRPDEPPPETYDEQ